MTKFYRLAWIVLRGGLFLLMPLRVKGQTKLPEGGVILVSNHISNWDVITLARIFDRQIHYMAKKELFTGSKFIKKLVEALGAFPVDRGSADLAAIRTSMTILKDGEVLGIFPQGTRVKDDSSFEMAGGVSMIALRSGAKVVPVHITAPCRIFSRVKVNVGEAFVPCEEGARMSRELLEQISGEIARRVVELKDA